MFSRFAKTRRGAFVGRVSLHRHHRRTQLPPPVCDFARRAVIVQSQPALRLGSHQEPEAAQIVERGLRPASDGR